MSKETLTVCPECRHEYDAGAHWLVCPECGHETGQKEACSDMILEDLDLSTRVLNSLHQQDVRTVGDLVALSPPELMRFRNFGQKCLEEVRDALAWEGLKLKFDDYSLT